MSGVGDVGGSCNDDDSSASCISHRVKAGKIDMRVESDLGRMGRGM